MAFIEQITITIKITIIYEFTDIIELSFMLVTMCFLLLTKKAPNVIGTIRLILILFLDSKLDIMAV